MAFEIKPNSGSLWVNDRKEPGNPAHESHPDRTGQGVIECPHCGKSWGTWVNGWLKKSKKDGTQYLSLSFKPKDQQQGQQRGGPPPLTQPQGRQQGGDGNRYAEAKSGGGGGRAGPNVSGGWRDSGGPVDDDTIPF